MSEPFLAPKGTRDEFFLKLVKRIKKPEYTMHFMVDREGRKAMFYNIKGGLEGFDEGDCILMKATVARHDVRNGEAQTYLNRCVFCKNYGKKDGKPENKKRTWHKDDSFLSSNTLVQEPPWA